VIVDPHHHLLDRGGQRYLIEEITTDLACGHNVVATVYVEARSMYRVHGAEAFRPVGEIEFANGAAAMSASGGYGTAAVCAGIVGHVNLLLGDAAKAVLEAEIAAGGGRFRGIRHSSAWDADENVAFMYATRPKGLLLDSTFRRGFACLAPLGLSFDAWLFHPQIGELTNLARAFPDQKIVLDHCGGPAGIGSYANAALFGRTGGGMAALYRNLHRGVWPCALHVREQLSSGQRPVQLSSDLQCLQTHCEGL
jgi:predicted TIM-barrel fold metal-dependent hydrolase